MKVIPAGSKGQRWATQGFQSWFKATFRYIRADMPIQELSRVIDTSKEKNKPAFYTDNDNNNNNIYSSIAHIPGSMHFT